MWVSGYMCMDVLVNAHLCLSEPITSVYVHVSGFPREAVLNQIDGKLSCPRLGVYK